LRSEYPESEYQFQAHLLGLQCKLRLYQGPDYEGVPLAEAAKLADQLLKQFPDKIGDERERVQKIRLEIAAQQAGREWRMAEYYAAHDAYGAARFYYKNIISEYPDTKLAEDARRRMGEFQSEPDVPEQQFEWLVKMFPEGRKRDLVAEQAAILQAEATKGTDRK
jgi:outer membrane protein assembly factor BamD (BamD/ComL family)